MTIELKSLIRKVRYLPLKPEKLSRFNALIITDIQAYFVDMNSFVSLSLKSELTQAQGKQLSAGLAIGYYLQSAVSMFSEISTLYQKLVQKHPGCAIRLHQWFVLLHHFKKGLTNKEVNDLQLEFTQLLNEYPNIKEALISAAINEKESVAAIDMALQIASLSRRFSEQLLHSQKAYLALVDSNLTEKTETKLN